MKLKNIAFFSLLPVLYSSFGFADSRPIKIAPDYVGTITYSGQYNYYARNPRQNAASGVPEARLGSFYEDDGTGIAIYNVYYEGNKFVATLISNKLIRGKTEKPLPEKIEGTRTGMLCKPDDGERFYCTNEIFIIKSKGEYKANKGVSYELRARPNSFSMK